MFKDSRRKTFGIIMLALGGLFVSCDKKTLRSETQPSRLGVSDVGGVDGGPEGQATDTLGGSREQIATNGPNDAGNEVDAQAVRQGGPTNSDLKNPFNRQAVGLQTNYAVTHNGQARTFHFFVPSDVNGQTAYPLVILLHGHGGSSDQMLGITGRKAPYKVWLDVAAREKVFILVPEGVISPDDKLGWNDCRGDTTTNPATDDVGFVVELAAAMADIYPIDENRIYVSGTSNGGHMSFRLAIEAGEKFAAIAPVAAALPTNSKCSQPDTQVALLLINGTNDTILPYGGGPMPSGRGEVLSTADTISFWKNQNQNTAIATVENLPDIDVRDASTIVRKTYSGETRIQDVVLVTMDGAGHTEPSISEQFSVFFESIVGKQNHDVEMAEVVWAFFKDKTR